MSCTQNEGPKFITDENVGKLTKLLRLLGYDTVFFTGENDTQLVNIALDENRTILTRDTHIQERSLVTGGRVRTILIQSDNIEEQIQQVVTEMDLLTRIKPFTRCLEDNQSLVPRTQEEVRDRVPPYVFETQQEYVECTECRRIYWKGTHWKAMTVRLMNLMVGKRGIVK